MKEEEVVMNTFFIGSYIIKISFFILFIWCVLFLMRYMNKRSKCYGKKVNIYKTGTKAIASTLLSFALITLLALLYQSYMEDDLSKYGFTLLFLIIIILLLSMYLGSVLVAQQRLMKLTNTLGPKK